jgi:predicted DNA-binding transcriptional regulator AlpA
MQSPEPQRQRRLLQAAGACGRVGFTSTSALYSAMDRLGFPKPVKISVRRRPPSGRGRPPISSVEFRAPMPTARNKPASRLLGKEIKAQFCDGKWHSFATIVSRTGAPAKNVWSTLDLMWRWGTYRTKCERKKVGTEYHFRLSPEEKQVSVHELIERLTPILKELEIQGRANAATMSPPTVRIMTAKIQKLLEEWADDRPAGQGDQPPLSGPVGMLV